MNKMTHNEMLKYSAELVVKNNPDEAIKLLILLQQENESFRDRIAKAIEYIETENSIGNEIEYTTRLLDILRGEENENNS